MILKEELFNLDPFSIELEKKEKIFKKYINELNLHHYKNSNDYKKLLKFLNFNKKKVYDIKDAPFLPVRLFKEVELKSIKESAIIKVLNSSGTSDSSLSKIFLDNQNSNSQSKSLSLIMQSILGKKRVPMLIVDKNSKFSDRRQINARTAAINGFSIFGRDHFFLLNNDDSINYDGLNLFLSKNKDQKIFIFGFTSLIYENLIQKLVSNNLNFDMKNAILLHGGGWKKMEKEKISNKKFKSLLSLKLGIKNIRNYYGLVEQTGSIFIECPCGYFVTSNFSDILIRDKNFKIVKNNVKGFVQLISLLPTSYPGHNILTEDLGEIINKPNCNCSLEGKRFLIHGRVKEAEIRGCSDV